MTSRQTNHNGRRRNGGRIFRHERDTDDSTPTVLGGGLSAEHQAAIFATEDQGMSDAVRKDHRSRLRRIIKWLQENYPDVSDGSVRVVTIEEKENSRLYYFPADNYDLVYAGLDPKYILAFLATLKNAKEGGKFYCPSHISKFFDAIKWGSSIANQRLSTNFFQHCDTFMSCYKKEYADQKKKGNVDEREADAISSSLFKLLLRWAVDEGNVFVWCFSLLMWHLMARSINVDSIALHSIKRGISDSITFKYDETKMDKTGEFVQEKNCYANPHEPFYCVFTALGCYLSLNAEALEKTEKLFINPGSQFKTAAQTCAPHIHEMGIRYADQLQNYGRLSHFNIHGVRKGSGTHAASATTAPPLFTSIACRGEWSMGKILDIYFRFAAGGDYYLGQLLSLKDPMHPNFNVPCAHWKDPDDPIVLEGIKLTFGKILLSHENTDHDPQGVLSFLLAAMVHHYDWILTICQEHPKHPFNSISLFSSPLLAKLKDCLTMELNSHVPIVTGIPPFVEQLCRINRHEAIAKSIKEDVGNVVEVLEEAVSNAIDKKVKADGGINSSILDERLKKLQDLLMQRLDEVGGTMASCPVEPEVAITGNQIDILQRKNTFYYRGKFWCVPESFAFPSEVTRLNGWRMWLKGKAVVVDNKTYMIKPFSHLKGSDLPRTTE